MIYQKVNNSYIGLLREEEEKTWLFYPRAYPKPHFMNKVVHEIWELIDGISDEKIADVLKTRYPKVDKKTLLNDVQKTIAYFVNLEMVKEVADNMQERQTVLTVLEEADFTMGSKFVIKTIEESSDNTFLFYPEQYEGDKIRNYYKAINMRTNHFHDVEIYIKAIDTKLQEVVGILGIYVCPNNCVVYITTTVFRDKKYLEEAIKGLELMLVKQNVKEIKVKFTDTDLNSEEKWKTIGFSKESIILKEAQNGSNYVIFGKEI